MSAWPPAQQATAATGIRRRGQIAETAARTSAGTSVNATAGRDVLSVIAKQRVPKRQQFDDPLVRDSVIDGRVLTARQDEATPTQARQVIRDLGLRQTEPRHELADRQLAVLPQKPKDPDARGIAQRSKVLRHKLRRRRGFRKDEWSGGQTRISHC